MGYIERVEIYKKIEEERKRSLIVYVTSSRLNASGQMASDLIPEFTKQLIKIPQTEKKIDVLIVSQGGDPTVSWRIISLLRERFNEIGVLLPYAAFSAATLLALGANEILMHPFSNLGPVDPQLSYNKKNTTEKILFGAEDLNHFLDFVRKDVGISDQEQLGRAFDLVCKEIGAIPIGVAKRSSYLSLSMGEKLLSLHMKDQNKVKAISEALSKSFYHHGYAVGRKEAKEIGLPIKNPGDNLEELMWQIWEDLEQEMQCNIPFNPLELVLNDSAASSLLGPVPQAQIPSNLPPNILNQAISSIISQINIVNVNPINFETFNATLESCKCRSECKVNGIINAVRTLDLKIDVGVLNKSAKWVYNETAA